MKLAQVAIVGAGGCVGREMLTLLESEDWVGPPPQLYGSERSRGNFIEFRGEPLPVRVLGDADGGLQSCDIALFAAGGNVSREWAARFVAVGAKVIDNSSAFRLDPEVPLVVPELNADEVSAGPGIIANPNCSTIILLLGIEPLRALGNFKVIVSTYQAVSGAGQPGLDALQRERSGGAFQADDPFPFPIEGNLFPLIGAPDAELGITVEELKMVQESRKILRDPQLEVYVTCVRVAVERCHSESVTLMFDDPAAAELGRARQLLAAAPGVLWVEDSQQPPTPLGCRQQHAVHVGRLRKPAAGVLQLWIVGDQLLKGAALNAVQIARCVVAQ